MLQAPRRSKVPLPASPFCLGQKLRIVHRLGVGCAQHLDALGWSPGGNEKWTAKLCACKYDLCRAATYIRGLVLIHDLIERGHVGGSRIALPACLEKQSNESFLTPTDERFPTKIGVGVHPAANDFAPFYCYVDLAPARIDRK